MAFWVKRHWNLWCFVVNKFVKLVCKQHTITHIRFFFFVIGYNYNKLLVFLPFCSYFSFLFPFPFPFIFFFFLWLLRAMKKNLYLSIIRPKYELKHSIQNKHKFKEKFSKNGIIDLERRFERRMLWWNFN